MKQNNMFRNKLFRAFVLFYTLSCLSCAMGESHAVPIETKTTPFLYRDDAVIKKSFSSIGGMDYNRDFELTIKGNGQVTLDGTVNFLKPLHAEWKVPPENFLRLVEAFENSEFYTLKEKSDGPVLNHPSTLKISISVNGKEKKVDYSSWTPSEYKVLRDLQTLINQETGAEPYIRQFCHYSSDRPSEAIP